MKVEIWSDFVCPFCYIGKRRFEEALATLPFKDEVEVVFRSFELDPHAEQGVAHDVNEVLAKKYGMSVERAREMNAGLADQARGVGLTYNYKDWKYTSTFNAHRLAQFAAERGVGQQMTERLLYAYFTEGKHLGDVQTLVALAAEVGLDRAEVENVLSGDAFTDAVRSDENEAAALGVRGVPFFVIDRKYGVSGAQQASTFAGALQKAWEESRPSLTVVGSGTADGCSDGSCAVPPAKQ